MIETEKTNISKMVKILMQLDEKSLILIDSGAKLLMARQNMEKESREDVHGKDFSTVAACINIPER